MKNHRKTPESDAEYHSPSSVEEVTAKNVEAIARLDRRAKESDSKGDQVASAITSFCGSMAFVWIHVAWFATWIVWNSIAQKPIDPYPYSFLTLVVSLEAIFLSTFIMIAENRQERIAERRSHLDLQVNLLAEQENTKMLELLAKIARKVGVDPDDDPEISVLEQATRPDVLVQQIDRSVEAAGKETAVQAES